jgi:hypothetical protein
VKHSHSFLASLCHTLACGERMEDLWDPGSRQSSHRKAFPSSCFVDGAASSYTDMFAGKASMLSVSTRIMGLYEIGNWKILGGNVRVVAIRMDLGVEMGLD